MLKYLKNINFNGSVAFIDVGWKCSTQNALSHFGNVDIWGLYLGIHPHAKEDVHGKGYLFDKEYSNYFYTVMGGMSLLEAFFTAPEKSLKKYEMNDSDDDVCFEYEIGDSKDNIVIGNVGRFSAQKNHRYFLDLAEKLDNKFVFLLLGNGELKEEFIEKVKECGLEDKFRVVSAKTDVERYYSAMDVFVMPSIFEIDFTKYIIARTKKLGVYEESYQRIYSTFLLKTQYGLQKEYTPYQLINCSDSIC